MIATLRAIFTAPAAFLGTHPALLLAGATVELIAVIITLDVLRRRDTRRIVAEPVSLHPGRSCDQACDVTDDAHGGCVWMSWAAS